MEVSHSSGEILGNTSGGGGEARLFLEVVFKQVAPGSGREVEVSIRSSKLIRDNREFEGVSKHDIALSLGVGISIIGEFEVKRLVESTNQSLLHHRKLSVVVSDESVLGLNSILHDINIGQCGAFGDGLGEHWLPRFLGEGSESVVVPGEGVEGANNVPSCAKLLGGVSNETTDVRAGQRNTKNVVHHNSGNRVTHVLLG